MLTLISALAPQKTQDYQNPFNIGIVAHLISRHFFEGEDSVYAKYPEFFKGGPKELSEEKEVPKPMLGIVCASVGLIYHSTPSTLVDL